jgi:hypothetical protein
VEPGRNRGGEAVEQVDFVAVLREVGEPSTGVGAVRVGKEREPEAILSLHD